MRPVPSLSRKLIDAREGGLAKEDAELAQLLVIHRDADATGFLQGDNHCPRPWRCGLLDEAGRDEFVHNHVHLLCGRGVDAVGPRRERRVVRGNRNLEGGQ